MKGRAGVKGLMSIKSITLVELVISIIIVSIMVLSFYSLETYGHQQVVGADRRANVQNNLAYCLEHISKYVQQANGNFSRKAIQYYPGPGAAGATGFQIWVDFNMTPSNFADDASIRYTLSANTLSMLCTGICGPLVSGVSETLSSKIIANFNNSILPVSPADGFYVVVDPLGNFVDVGLVGRYAPTLAATRLTNPQVAMKTRLICNGSSTN